eukprot:c23135_g1_i1 orf=250-4686(-)
MGPKKNKGKAGGDSRKGGNAGRSSRAAKSAAQVHLSSESERRMRRLLQNTGRMHSAPENMREDLTELEKKQAAKRLRNIYDTLAREGFSSSQIESALQALPVGEISLEDALDWLCLNLPGDELPQKFSSGAGTATDEGGSVQLLAVARPEVKPSVSPATDIEKEHFCENVLVNRRQPREELEKERQSEQADWIRCYMAQLEEDENNSDGHISEADSSSNLEILADLTERQHGKDAYSIGDPTSRALSIESEFEAARKAAADAKGKGDKLKQIAAGQLLRNLKLEMAFLGISEDSFQKKPGNHNAGGSVNNKATKNSMPEIGTSGETVKIRFPDGPEISSLSDISEHICEISKSGQETIENTHLEVEGDILGLFDENAQENRNLPESVLELQRKQRADAWAKGTEHSEKKKIAKKDNKEDTQRLPRAILQQQCQKNGWEIPKYNKLSTGVNAYSCSVTIVRLSYARGKNKKIGGPVTYNFPGKESRFKSIEEAQNAVATWALFSLFPDLPLYRIIPEPYRGMCLGWHTQGKQLDSELEIECSRRLKFVNSLLNSELPQNEKLSIGSAVELEAIHGIINNDKVSLHGMKNENQLEESRKSYKEAESCTLLHTLEEKMKTKEYKKMLNARAALPIAAVKQQLLEQIWNNEVTVVSGETGCGKTTQVPQYILEEMISTKCGGMCNIICTQPRRIAAISVAERVAVEQCDPAPGVGGSLVGYQVRLNMSWNPGTKLLFCTTGILLRRIAGDRDLSGVSHIIVDEVHERSMLGDFALIILKDLLERRRANGMPLLKVILMSATVDAQMFSRYFWNCWMITVEGRTFPVRTLYLEDVYECLDYRLTSDSPVAMANSYKTVKNRKISQSLVDSGRGRWDLVQSGWGDEDVLEKEIYNPFFEENLFNGFSDRTQQNLAKVNEDMIDYDLLEDLIKYIDETGEAGAILVFLPGMAEIQLLLDRLAVSRHFSGAASQWLLPLHSSIALSDQRKAFQSPESGVRKIVVATSIAETSITIDDVVHVIDCGKHKEIRYDARRGISSLVEVWISRANAKQRRGRAGRVKPGNCFCLYTRHRFEKLMLPFQIPEMLRAPLVELCLQIKFLSLGNIALFLEKAMQAPKSEAVKSAISTLYEVGAFNEKEELTPLGYHLAKLPVDVRIGKMMLYGAVFGCLSPLLTIAACMSYKSPFTAPRDQADAVERAKKALVSEKSNYVNSPNIARGQQSDHLAMVAAYNGWITVLRQRGAKAAYEHCKSNFLSGQTLSMIRDMRIQFATLLADIGFVNLKQVGDVKVNDVDQFVDDTHQPYNCNAQFAFVVKAILCAGLYPNVAAMDEESIQEGHASAHTRRAGLASARKAHWYDGRREVFIHPSSVNHNLSEFHYPFLVFHEKVETSKVYLHHTSVVSPYALLLFGGTIIVQHQTGLVTVDGWLKMKAPAQTAVLFKELRSALDTVLQMLIERPQGHISSVATDVVPSIVQLLADEDRLQS